jgi:hypothetical protein
MRKGGHYTDEKKRRHLQLTATRHSAVAQTKTTAEAVVFNAG